MKSESNNKSNNNNIESVTIRSNFQKDSNKMTVSILNRGSDFNDYEIKNSANGQISITRVVFLAD